MIRPPMSTDFAEDPRFQKAALRLTRLPKNQRQTYRRLMDDLISRGVAGSAQQYIAALRDYGGDTSMAPSEREIFESEKSFSQGKLDLATEERGDQRAALLARNKLKEGELGLAAERVGLANRELDMRPRSSTALGLVNVGLGAASGIIGLKEKMDEAEETRKLRNIIFSRIPAGTSGLSLLR